MQIKQTLTTASKYAGTNTCEFIILHHTATKENTIKGVLNHLTTSGQASCHYVVDTNGDIYKIGNDKDILWHAGASEWKEKKDKYGSLNSYSIGIEIIGPLSDGGFTDAQRSSVAIIVKELASKYSVPKENILRHKDIAPKRKTDVADSFWIKQFGSYDQYINSLFFKPQPIMASKYTEIMQKALKETGFTPIFGTHEGDKPLTEQETKELIEIAMARLFQRLQAKK